MNIYPLILLLGALIPGSRSYFGSLFFPTYITNVNLTNHTSQNHSNHPIQTYTDHPIQNYTAQHGPLRGSDQDSSDVKPSQTHKHDHGTAAAAGEEPLAAVPVYVYNASTLGASPHCPMLYTRVGHRCLAFFTIARVPWTTAREFCHGIYGDLLTFSDVQQYTDLVEYLQAAELGVELWVGGRETVEGLHRWVWMDGTPMPIGTPYWAIRSTTTSVLGRKINTYTQAPFCQVRSPSVEKDQNGRCAAMSPKYYYYLTDEDCKDWKSPVCVLREGAQVMVVAGGSQVTYPDIFLPTQDPTIITASTIQQGASLSSSSPPTPSPSSSSPPTLSPPSSSPPTLSPSSSSHPPTPTSTSKEALEGSGDEVTQSNKHLTDDSSEEDDDDEGSATWPDFLDDIFLEF
nr:uncharacterized protein LOC123762274 [Procambarus clarkii]